MSRKDEKALKSEFRASVRRLTCAGASGYVDELELHKAEILARLIELNARRRIPVVPFVIVVLLVLGFSLLHFRLNSVAVRLRVETRAGSIRVAAEEEIPLRLVSEGITINRGVAVRTPAELEEMFRSGAGGVALQTDSGGALALQRVRLHPESKLLLHSMPNSVELQVQCTQNCKTTNAEFAAYGNIKAPDITSSLTTPRAIEFRPQGRSLRIQIIPRDTTAILLEGLQAVSEVSFRRSALTDIAGAPVITGFSAIQSGTVTFPKYPSRNRMVTLAEELEVSGSELRLLLLEIRSDKLVFIVDGHATRLMLDGEDIRPTLLDLLRIRPELLFLASLAGAIGGYVTLWNLIRGRTA